MLDGIRQISRKEGLGALWNGTKVGKSYSDDQQTLKYKDDFLTQVMTLNSSISMGHINCAV